MCGVSTSLLGRYKLCECLSYSDLMQSNPMIKTVSLMVLFEWKIKRKTYTKSFIDWQFDLKHLEN